MINIKQVKYSLITAQRKQKRDEAISLKRKLNTLSSPSTLPTTPTNLTSLLTFLLDNSSISVQSFITSQLISEDQSQLLFHIISNLQSPDSNILQLTLTIIGHISFNQKAEQLMNYDILPSLIPHLSHKKRPIRQLSLWILSNIAGEQSQPYATSMLNNIQLIDKLGEMLENESGKVKVDVLYLYRNLIMNGERKRVVEYLSDDDLFKGIKGMVGDEDQEVRRLVGEVLVEIVELGEEISGGEENVFRKKVEKFGLMVFMNNEMGDQAMKCQE